MFKNYLKIAWRHLLSNKSHSIINLAGLALGLACTMVILMWIRRELSVDQYHADLDRIYRIMENQSYSGGKIYTFAATPGPMAPAMKENYPEVEYASRVDWGSANLFRLGDQSFRERGHYTDPDFLRIFTIPFKYGDPNTAIDRPRTVAISEAMAEKYFGDGNPVGESIWVDDTMNYQVTGVFEDLPDHSTFQFDFLMPYEDYFERNQWLTNWNSNGIRTYLKLMPGTKGEAFAAKVDDFVVQNSNQGNVELLLQPFRDVYLRTDYQDGQYQGGGRITYVRLFAIIAAFILIIACINFMNLTTAQSARRAKEVGIRRVSGATKQRLVGQFLGESLLLTFIAGLLATGMVALILPYFNQLFDVELGVALLDGWSALGLLGLLVMTGLLAGSYPAFFLARFEPVRVLKGLTKRGGGALWLRKGMVIAQFAIATFLILSTVVIYKQMAYLRNKNLGYKKENLLTIRMMGQMWDKYETIKAELLRRPGVEAVSASNGYVYAWGNNTSNFSWQGKDPDENILFQTMTVDYDFLETIGAELLEGRSFSKEHPSDSANFVINQRSAELMGMASPAGQSLTYGNAKGTIIGLVRDFHVTSLYNEQDPVIMVLRPFKNFIYVRIRPEDVTATLARIEQTVEQHNPAYPFEFQFVDQEYDKLYRSEQRTSALSKIFAFLAIFVSCLGLFGLAAFATQQRTKEIGIRKVMGATVVQLSSLLSKEFLMLVLTGFLLATPVAWYMTRQWLMDFAYRISIEWWMIALAGMLALLIAFATVSIQTVRAASRNPVKALRYE
jgi:putative ABC transport system permease protein